MSDKQYSPEEVLNLQSAAYQKGYNEGYGLCKKENPQPQGAVWIKASERLPEKDDYINCRANANAEVLYYDKMQDGFYDKNGERFPVFEVEWLDESGTTSNNEDAHEKEIMMQAFCKVQQLFEGREWIMEGRGSYPYNDDRYKEEVRFLYDEFEAVRKDTWDNIKSKSVDYRKWIIDEYLKDNPSNKDEAVEFAEWIREQGIEPTFNKKWVDFSKSKDNRYTTAQLHDLWQQTKNK